jgi:hypothetical protein
MKIDADARLEVRVRLASPHLGLRGKALHSQHHRGIAWGGTATYQVEIGGQKGSAEEGPSEHFDNNLHGESGDEYQQTGDERRRTAWVCPPGGSMRPVHMSAPRPENEGPSPFKRTPCEETCKITPT